LIARAFAVVALSAFVVLPVRFRRSLNLTTAKGDQSWGYRFSGGLR